MTERSKARILWIDCAKTVAIVAVLVDHSNHRLYTNQDIALASYFSVCLFVLLAGVTIWNSWAYGCSMGGGATVALLTPVSKLRSLLADYAVAVFLLQIWYTRFFDVKTYLIYLVNFSIQAPYYFLVFFLQLKLIAPALVSWCRFCNGRKGKWGWQITTLVFLGWFASILIRFTYVLPVHGGGKYLFGGTFLLLYYFGMLLASMNIFEHLKKWCIRIFMISGAAWLVWWRMLCEGKLTLDQYLVPYWGNGFNPPSAQLMIFGVITLFLTYSGFTLLEKSVIGKYAVRGFAIIGKNSLYIFMYHLMVRDVICTLFPSVQQNIWIFRFFTFAPMILAPVLAITGIRKLVGVFQVSLQK